MTDSLATHTHDDERTRPVAGTGGSPDVIRYLKNRLKLHERIAESEATTTFVSAVLAAVDAREPEAFLSFLSQDCTFRFASSAAIIGKPAVAAMVAGFFSSTTLIQHHVDDAWTVDRNIIVRGSVRYRFSDERDITVPFCDIFTLSPDGLIQRYEIYSDLNV